jgi:uncharacterized protein (TIRG00374 family)
MIRRILIQFLKIAVSVFLIGWLLQRIGIENILNQFRSVTAGWIIAAFLLFTVSHFLGSFQWWLLLRSENIELPWKKTLGFYFIGLFFNNFLISSMGGDFFRIIDVRRISNNGTGSVSTVFLDRFMGLVVLTGMTVFALPWILIKGGFESTYQLLFITLLIGWFFLLFFFFNKSFAKPFAWLIKKIIPKRISVKAREVYRKIHNFGSKKKLVLQVILISIGVQSARIIMHYLAGRSLGISISLLYFFLIIPVVAVMASLPVTIGGIGLRESTAVLLFGWAGVAGEITAPMEFLAYLIAIATSIPGGLYFIIRKTG